MVWFQILIKKSKVMLRKELISLNGKFVKGVHSPLKDEEVRRIELG